MGNARTGRHLEMDRRLVDARGWGYREIERMGRETAKDTEFLFQKIGW